MTAKTQPPAPQLALIDQAFEAEIVKVSTVEYNSNAICRKFYEELRKRIEANYSTQSRPEAELPEVTDEAVERLSEWLVKNATVIFDQKGRGLDARVYDKHARAALQAAYGQQCAATRQTVEVPELQGADMAMHWIDRYAAGIDDECQLDRVKDALMASADKAVGYVGQDGSVTFYVDDFSYIRQPKAGTELFTRPAEVGGDGVERDAARFRALESWFDELTPEQSRLIFDFMDLPHADPYNAAFSDATDALIENRTPPAPGSEVRS